MRITAKEMTIELQKIWPSLKDIWLWDSAFICPSFNELIDGLSRIKDIRLVVENELKNHGIETLTRYIHNRHDCDNYALELRADVSRYGLKKVPEYDQYLPALGAVSAMKANGREINHTFNFCRTEKGIIFIEPRDFTTWKASSITDWPYFMEIG